MALLYAATKTENKTGEEKKPSTLKSTGRSFISHLAFELRFFTSASNSRFETRQRQTGKWQTCT